ncbi:MAG: hypothetical protein WKF76_10360 [Nocardioidaceae bacterium]
MAADISGASLVEQVASAADVLEQRISTMASQLDGAAATVLTKAIDVPAGPEVGFPLFARIPAAALTGVRAEPVAAGQAPRLYPTGWKQSPPSAPLWRGWKQRSSVNVSAVVANRCARGRTHQGDLQTATATSPADDSAPPSRLVAVFGPSGVLPNWAPAATTGGDRRSRGDRPVRRDHP